MPHISFKTDILQILCIFKVRSLFVLLKQTFYSNPPFVQEDNTKFALAVKIATENQQTSFQFSPPRKAPIESALKMPKKMGGIVLQLNLCHTCNIGQISTLQM
jgi:hypothetical protein